MDKKPPRAGSHWDGDRRALWGRGKTEPGGGIPVEVDPEMTPPPAPPPEAEDFERMTPAQQLAALHSQAQTNQTAIAAVWPVRHAGVELAEIKRAVDGYTRQVDQHQTRLDDFVMPAIRTQLGRVTALEQAQTENWARMRVFFDNEWPAHQKAISEIASALKDITGRIGRIEAKQDKFADSITTHEARITSVEKQINAVDVRVTALERVNADERLVATTAASERKRIFTMARVSLATLGAAIGALATQIPAFIQWLSK